MQSPQQGFTLIDLMITVAVIGILAAIAAPSYQIYTKRAKITEGIGLARDARVGAIDYRVTMGRWPASGASIPYPTPSSPYVRSVTVAGNAVTVTYAATVGTGGGSTIVFSATLSSGAQAIWSCNGGDMSDRYRPSVCRN